MILTVTLNAALDVTYAVDAVTPDTVHRVRSVAERAGGKGVNVARVLHTLGHDVIATGLAGGATGAAIRAGLAGREAFVSIAGESRRTVTVVAGSGATAFHEPGPAVTGAEWAAFRDRFARLATGAAAVVLSGSLPPGLPDDAYAQLVAAAPVPVVLDADGVALLAALPAGPSVIKPNAAELAATTGLGDPLRAAEALRAKGARAVVASLGPGGLLAVTPEGTWRARPAAPIGGNPTGAGDACVAALAAGLDTGLDTGSGTPWPELLHDAAALAAAAVATPVAGEIDLVTYRTCPIDVEELE